MAELSLYLTNVSVSIGQNMAVQQTQGPNPTKDFESVELGDLDKREPQRREKVPRRIIHFSSGETMEEYSTDEEEGEDREPERKDLLPSPADASKMTWGPYFWFHMWRAATSTISVVLYYMLLSDGPLTHRSLFIMKPKTITMEACDYLGERMASLFGITSAKYQYAIDEYYRMKKEREEEKEENRLSEEAERSFEQLQSQEQPEDKGQPDVGPTHPSVSYQIENESQAVQVPAVIKAN